MKPRCKTHNRTMRWIPWRRLWICRILKCREVILEPGPNLKRAIRPLITNFADGRLLLRGRVWKFRKLAVWLRDGGRCVGCGRVVAEPASGLANEAEIHHKRSRGMHGAFRDDRGENLETLCKPCHLKAKNEPRWSGKKMQTQ